MLGHLDERAKRIVRLRYGLVDGIEWTGAAIARELGLSRDRVRQLEQEALVRLEQIASWYVGRR